MLQIRPAINLKNISEVMTETAKTDTAITEAETELKKTGQLFDAEKALTALRRKHFG